MRSHTRLLSVVLISVVASLCSGQESSIAPPATDANSVGGQQFPYVVEVTGNDVYVRSGPGTNHYQCGKCNSGDRVKVVSTHEGWSRIVPPAGCFSWMSTRYMSMNMADPNEGTVTGDRIRIYAGSDSVEPLHSQAVQTKLDRGESIRIVGGGKDDYCKIKPPTGAYLWISSKFTKPVKGTITMVVPPDVADPCAVVDANGATIVKPVATDTAEAKRLAEYRELEKKIAAEKVKPLEQQKYDDIKTALEVIIKDEQAGRAKKYAEYALLQIKRFELAVKVNEELGTQSDELKEILDGIDSVRQAKLAGIKNMGMFAAVGIFQTSSIYGPEASVKLYRIVDETGKTVCYASPTKTAIGKDFSSFVKQKVGLIGEISPHTETGGAKVKFTEVILMDE